MKIYSNVLSRSFTVLDINVSHPFWVKLCIWCDIWSNYTLCFPGGMVKNQPANAGDISNVGLIYGLGRSPGEGTTTLLYSFLENPMDRGTWRATVHRVIHSWTTEMTQLYCMGISSCPNTTFFPHWTVLSSLLKIKLTHNELGLFLDSQFYSIDLCLSLCQYNTILISKLSIQEMWSLQFCSFPVLFWLFMVLFVSIWIFRITLSISAKYQVGFWEGLYWKCRSVLGVLLY